MKTLVILLVAVFAVVKCEDVDIKEKRKECGTTIGMNDDDWDKIKKAQKETDITDKKIWNFAYCITAESGILKPDGTVNADLIQVIAKQLSDSDDTAKKAKDDCQSKKGDSIEETAHKLWYCVAVITKVKGT